MADLKILIVEDEMIVAVDLKKQLEKLGYTIIDIVTNGEDAIKMAGETHPDLVLMDILLEGDIDGIEATKQIRKLYNIPVIYLTGYNDKPTLEKANITKPNGYILKPYQISGIQKTIKITLINTPSIQAIPNNNIL